MIYIDIKYCEMLCIVCLQVVSPICDILMLKYIPWKVPLGNNFMFLVFAPQVTHEFLGVRNQVWFIFILKISLPFPLPSSICFGTWHIVGVQ